MQDNLYEYIIKDKQGNALVTLDTAKNRQFNLYLNKTPDAQFDISLDDPKIDPNMLLLGDKELYIYREGILLWGGELSTSDTKVDDTNETMTVTAKGFFDLLSKKNVGTAAAPVTYSATDAGTIVSALLAAVQTGTNQDFGITAGVIQASVNRTVSYSYIDLQQIILQLCGDNIDNGFDFDIDPLKKLNIWYPQRGMQRKDIVFEYGRNIVSFEDKSDATNLANEIIVLGSGSGGGMATEIVDDSTQQVAYKVRQAILSKKDTSDSGILTDMGQAQLDTVEIPQKELTVELKGNADPILGSYNCGDSPRVKITKGFYVLDEYLRISQIAVTISDDNDEKVVVTLNRFIKDVLNLVLDMTQRLQALETA